MKTNERYIFNWKSEFGLYCGKGIDELADMETSFYIAQMIGTFSFNTASDLYGRKPLILLMGLGLALTRYFLWLPIISGTKTGVTAFMFLNGVFLGGYMCVSYTYVLEIVNIRRRAIFSSSMNAMWSFSSLIMTFIFYQYRSWRVNSLFLALFFTVSCILTLIFAVEPPKYFLIKQNKKGFLDSCAKILKINKDFSKETMNEIEELYDLYVES